MQIAWVCLQGMDRCIAGISLPRTFGYPCCWASSPTGSGSPSCVSRSYRQGPDQPQPKDLLPTGQMNHLSAHPHSLRPCRPCLMLHSSSRDNFAAKRPQPFVSYRRYVQCNLQVNQADATGPPEVVPARDRSHLATPAGSLSQRAPILEYRSCIDSARLLFNELLRSPRVLSPSSCVIFRGSQPSPVHHSRCEQIARSCWTPCACFWMSCAWSVLLWRTAKAGHKGSLLVA